MHSLSTHLVETGDHGRLPFHPGCPVCRLHRLHGALPAEALISSRTQAALAAGVLAFSAATPAVSVAVEPDQQQEGGAAPGESGEAPGFDPGGDTGLPFEVPAGPLDPSGSGGGSDDGDGEPVEGEPLSDPEARLAPTEQAAPVSEQPPTPSGESVPTPTGPPPAAQQNDREATDTHQAPSRTDKTERRRSARTRNRAPNLNAVPRSSPSAAVQPAPVSPTSGTDSSLAQTGGSATIDRGSEASSGAATRDDRVYVVKPGDSLWSIAKELIGTDASVAGVAREVNRLWELNKDRIGTGDPDLLMVGTKLRLR